jgi:hypothetical protein
MLRAAYPPVDLSSYTLDLADRTSWTQPAKPQMEKGHDRNSGNSPTVAAAAGENSVSPIGFGAAGS